MNCLLLLIILFCCGGNGNGHSHEHTCDNVNRCNMRNRNEVRNYSERKDKECGCHYENDSFNNNNSCHTPPPMPRAQFPYLDVEPRTCGCEEKSNS